MLRKMGAAALLIVGYALLVVVGGYVFLLAGKTGGSLAFVWLWAAWPFVVSVVLGWWAGSLLGGALSAALVGLIVGCLNAIVSIHLGLSTHPAMLVIFILPMGAGAILGQRLQFHLSPSDAQNRGEEPAS